MKDVVRVLEDVMEAGAGLHMIYSAVTSTVWYDAIASERKRASQNQETF